MVDPIYRDYSVLPRLIKIDPSEVFQPCADRQRYLDQKKEIVECQPCDLEHEMTAEIYSTICEFLISNYPYPLSAPITFSNLAMQMHEDLAVHRLSDDSDWLAATHICFPSGWNPQDKIGQTFEEAHTPIPGMNLKVSRKLVETMVYHGPFERFVWSLIYEDRLNFHPFANSKNFDPNNPILYIKVERQVTVGFPWHQAALFILKQTLIPEYELDKKVLLQSLMEMSPKERDYKGISEDLIQYLKDAADV